MKQRAIFSQRSVIDALASKSSLDYCSDITFKCGEKGEPVNGHKMILGVGTGSWLLQQCLADVPRCEPATVILPDVDPETMELFITLSYTGEARCTEEQQVLLTDLVLLLCADVDDDIYMIEEHLNDVIKVHEHGFDSTKEEHGGKRQRSVSKMELVNGENAHAEVESSHLSSREEESSFIAIKSELQDCVSDSPSSPTVSQDLNPVDDCSIGVSDETPQNEISQNEAGADESLGAVLEPEVPLLETDTNHLECPLVIGLLPTGADYSTGDSETPLNHNDHESTDVTAPMEVLHDDSAFSSPLRSLQLSPVDGEDVAQSCSGEPEVTGSIPRKNVAKKRQTPAKHFSHRRTSKNIGRRHKRRGLSSKPGVFKPEQQEITAPQLPVANNILPPTLVHIPQPATVRSTNQAQTQMTVKAETSHAVRNGTRQKAKKKKPEKHSRFKRRRKCGECEACKRKDCQVCTFCLDMKKYGGKQQLKQCCVQRKCLFKVIVRYSKIPPPPPPNRLNGRRKVLAPTNIEKQNSIEYPIAKQCPKQNYTYRSLTCKFCKREFMHVRHYVRHLKLAHKHVVSGHELDKIMLSRSGGKIHSKNTLKSGVENSNRSRPLRFKMKQDLELEDGCNGMTVVPTDDVMDHDNMRFELPAELDNEHSELEPPQFILKSPNGSIDDNACGSENITPEIKSESKKRKHDGYTPPRLRLRTVSVCLKKLSSDDIEQWVSGNSESESDSSINQTEEATNNCGTEEAEPIMCETEEQEPITCETGKGEVSITEPILPLAEL